MMFVLFVLCSLAAHILVTAGISPHDWRFYAISVPLVVLLFVAREWLLQPRRRR